MQDLRFRAHADVLLHAEAPLIALLRAMHIRATLLLLIFHRAGRRRSSFQRAAVS